MHDRFENLRRKNASQDLGVRYLLVPIAAIVLAVIAITRPQASHWIADAVEAEFSFNALAPSEPAATQLAQPDAAPRDSSGSVQTAYRDHK